MSRIRKPISKNANSKFVTRNNKQEIFSKFTKTTKPKAESTDDSKSETDKPSS